MADERDRFDFDKAAIAQMENIRRIGLRRLHCREKIDDFVQETLLRAFSKRCQLREPAKIDRWIAAIARNLAREWNRKKRNEPTTDRREAVDWRTPHDALEEAETREAMRKAFGRLNAADRELLRKRYLEEASYAELQERYGLSYSAVGVRLHRAKKRLRKIYMSITAALAFFFGGYQRAAMGGAFMMSKAAKIAIAAVVCGALIGSFYWAHQAAQERAAHERTNQTARGALNLSGNGKVADAAHKEKELGETETAAIQEENSAQTHADGSKEEDGKSEKIRNFRYERYDRTGDIEAFYFAYWEIRAAVNRVKNGELELSDVHALIDGYGFNPDWALFLRIDVKKQMGLPLSELERSNHMRGEIAIRHLLRQRYSDDRPKMKSQLKPIGDLARWAKQHAPDEYEIVWKHFFKTSAPSPGSLKTYLPVDAYVDWTYGSFFESLSLLPDDAKIFTEYFAKREAAAPAPAPVNIPPKASRPAPPAAVDPGAAESSAPPPSDPPSPPAKPAEFEAAEAEAEMERHGVQERLRRLAESHPEWAMRLLIWAEEGRKRAPAPPAPPRR